MGFNKKITTARKNAGYRTPEECSVALGAGISTIRHWERGTHVPRSDMLKSFCVLCDVSADDLLGLKTVGR